MGLISSKNLCKITSRKLEAKKMKKSLKDFRKSIASRLKRLNYLREIKRFVRLTHPRFSTITSIKTPRFKMLQTLLELPIRSIDPRVA